MIILVCHFVCLIRLLRTQVVNVEYLIIDLCICTFVLTEFLKPTYCSRTLDSLEAKEIDPASWNAASLISFLQSG